MLRKLPEIEIGANSPFDADSLDRRQPVEILTSLVESTAQPFVLSVEAPWGFGKTTFIKLWKAHLESRKHVCLYFNAWENDFVDDPLIAFLGEMRKFVEANLEKIGADEPLRASWEKVKRIGGGVLRKTLPLAVQIATHGLLNQKHIKDAADAIGDTDRIEEFASTLAKERMERYKAEKEGIADFRVSLETLAREVTKTADKKPPLIFFIDELDRCRPDFAIALLERVKHLFNVAGVIFVLAIDRTQLDQSVKALYGTDMRPDGYLRRFIDLAYQLPSPTVDSYAASLFGRFALGGVGHWGNDEVEFIRSFSEFARALCLSFRTQEQCFTEMNIALRTNPAIRHFPSILTFFSTLRAFRPEFVDELRRNEIQIDQVFKWISSVNPTSRLYAEAALLVEFSKDNASVASRRREIYRLTTPNLVSSGQELEIQYARDVRDLMDRLEKWQPNAARSILSHLTLTSGFSN